MSGRRHSGVGAVGGVGVVGAVGVIGAIGAVGLSALLVAGCAPMPPLERPYPAPTADQLVAALAARQRAVSGMNARARATSWLGGERVRATVNMLVERDGHLRFEAEVSLQGTVATLVTDGASFALLDARRNELSRGPACPANVASLIRIPLGPGDVAAVLLGDARLPEPSATGAPTVAWDPTHGADRLTLPEPDGGTVQLFFKGSGGAGGAAGAASPRDLIAVVRTDVRGARQWQTSYQSFETIGGQRLPGTILFAERNGSFDDGVEIRFKDRALDQPAPPAAFTLVPPPGVMVKEVGCRPGS
jgi:outer membrane lipoprotein-sorting protein